MARFVAWLIAVVASIAASALRAEVTIVDDGNKIAVSSAAYKVVLEAETGAILGIAEAGGDPLGGDWLTRTYFERSPWLVRLGESEWISPGGLLGRGGSASHEVSSSAEMHSVAWVYSLDEGGTRLSATMRYDFPRDHDAAFTGSFTVQPEAGEPLTLASFPAYLELPQDRGSQVVFPWRSGVSLSPAFLASTETIWTRLPGGFTPFVWWATDGGATFTISHPVEAAARDAALHEMSIQRPQNGERIAPVLHNDRLLELPAGPSSEFASGTVLFQLGRSAVDAAHAHWAAGESADYPLLSDKVDDATLETLRRAPLLKYQEVPFAKFGENWSEGEYAARQRRLYGVGEPMDESREYRLEHLPPAFLLHIPSFMPGGHDENFPDYLPPREDWGTLAEMQSLVNDVRAAGGLVIPYTNPTWWDDESPTMQALGLDVVATYNDGSPRHETYGDKAGYVVSPWHEDVRSRLVDGYNELVSAGIADILFEDQVGARSVEFDGNAASPEWWSYAAGTLENTRLGTARMPLMTELAWDRLAETESGFCGNLRLDWERPPLPADHWAPYPLAQAMASRHALFYPHNLAGEVMVHDRAELMYNVALGYQLAYDLGRGAPPLRWEMTPEHQWLENVRNVQSELLAHVAGEAIVGFEDNRHDSTTPATTTLTYANGATVVANWSTTESVELADVTLGPGGWWFSVPEPRPAGGWITHYRGVPLTDPPGRLYLDYDVTLWLLDEIR